MKKSILLICCVLPCLAFLTSCNEAPAWAATDEIEIKAHEIIEIFNKYDYDEVASKFSKLEVTGEEIEKSLDTIIRGYGEFEKYGEAGFSGGEDDDGQQYVTIRQVTYYERGTAAFDISFYEDGTLAGFYMQEK